MSNKKGRDKNDPKQYDGKFVDPRLVARESIFQQLHLSIFETMGYAQAVQQQVELTGKDIEPTNNEYTQLLRDYEITKNMTPMDESTLLPLCEQTDTVITKQNTALANCAQLCASAINALNHWRILNEIPDDLRDNDTVTKTIKEKYKHHVRMWRYIIEDLTGIQDNNASS